MASPNMISIHALREEGDTAPLWTVSCPTYFYPRPPRGGRLDSSSNVYGWVDISIHALREEGDALKESQGELHRLFLSTPSARRATPSQIASLIR